MVSKTPASAFLLVLPLLIALSLFACSKVPLSGREQLNMVPESSLIATSTQQYQQFLGSHQVIRNTSQSEEVTRVGQRIAQAVEEYFARQHRKGELKNYHWEFNLVASSEANAWAMPGGKVVVYKGILPITRTDAGLAAVIGHEVAHVVAKHGNERMSQQLIAKMGGMALSTALAKEPAATQQLWGQVFGVGTQVGVLLPFSRLQESEADRLGLIFMAMAGYDPHAAIGVWQRMMQMQGARTTPEFLSTHPSDAKRIRDIRREIPEAMSYYTPRP